MKTAIILHGMPSKESYFNPNQPSQSNSHWLPWLQQQLIVNGILAQTPELPEPFEPVYEKWLEIFNQFKFDENTMLIGHSCGAGFLVRWLTENNIKVGKVALVAPFLDPEHDEVKSDFFNLEIKKDLTEQTDGICIFYSTDDHPLILTSVDQILAADSSIEVKKFADKGHFTFNDLQSDKFPELVDYLTKDE